MSAQLDRIPGGIRPEKIAAEHLGLGRLFCPRAIALVGASQNASSISGQPLRHLLARGYAGRIYAVNPKYQEIGGTSCYPSVQALPEVPDLAIILLGANSAIEAVAECGGKGIPYAIVIGSGFAETGGEGTRMQDKLLAVARDHGLRLVGPNCQGMMNLSDDVFVGFGPAFGNPLLRTGSVSMVTQSGGFGYAVVSMAEQEGIGFRRVISTGNEADLSSLDFIEHLIDDAGTKVIAAYIEGMKDARRLLAVGRQALRQRKPVLIWKVGNSPEGKRAAASHTANLGGATELYQAAFDQVGWILIDDVQDLVDYTAAFRRGKLPTNNAVGVVTVSGGAGVLLADKCAGLGLQVPDLSPATHARLREVLPAYGSAQNPVDVTAGILNQPGLLQSVLSVIVNDPRVGSLLVVGSSVDGKIAERIAAELVELDARTDKPVLVSWSAREERVGNAYESLRAARIPLFRTPARCGRAMGALDRFAAALRRFDRDEHELTTLTPLNPNRLDLRAGEGAVEYQAKRILAAYGLTTTKERLASSSEQAAFAAAELGFPVALKIQSADIPHKTEAGGVELDLRDAASVEKAYDAIVARVTKACPAARIDGVLVQEMVAGGVETILGVVNDERFGPAVMFGLGGIFAEVLNDVVFRFPPVTPSGARDMVDSIRGRAVLGGVRGQPPADVMALADAIVRLSRAVEELGDRIEELDINPLVVLPDGRGVRALDALIRLRPSPGATQPAQSKRETS